MPDDVSQSIRECLIHAANYRYDHRTHEDAMARQQFHDMEMRWLDLAISYEFAYRQTRSMNAVG
jgi:hypothetical protein